TPKVGAVCGKAARTVLCGGRPVTGVPTAIRNPSARATARPFMRGSQSRASQAVPDRSGLRAPAPAEGGDAGEAEKAGERCGRGERRGRYRGEFSNDDLAVAGAEIGDQDLVYAGVKGAAAAAAPEV